ncbi:hypothetical protein LZG74_25555 [Dyadobacter sp. CY327]|uniref:hypothetical protein n=1 Tax=Dyadobacter sp. CY327 TaxID=2907301 RepID=UPI001F1F0B22|nr:hypothetical protein [Dyadobacter sp. CY327]MCE7073702.1 hypothetical protein [Dyadobacter sp. CY327]
METINDMYKRHQQEESQIRDRLFTDWGNLNRINNGHISPETAVEFNQRQKGEINDMIRRHYAEMEKNQEYAEMKRKELQTQMAEQSLHHEIDEKSDRFTKARQQYDNHKKQDQEHSY